jgi:guanylate kinase
MRSKGLLLAFAAPSGTGKTTVCHELLKLSDRFIFSVSCTTRQPRPSERDGIDYHFITREQFLANIRDGKMAEWQEVFGNYYGTLKSTVDEALTAGKILLLDIEVKGTLNLQKMYRENLISIFLLPPSKAELDRRLQNRGTDDSKSIALRNARIPDEMELSKRFDFQIVNDKLDITIQKILNIIEEQFKND